MENSKDGKGVTKLNIDQVMTCLSGNMLVGKMDDIYETLNSLLGVEVYTHLIPTGLTICNGIIRDKIGFQMAMDLVSDIYKECKDKNRDTRTDGIVINMNKYKEWKKERGYENFEIEIGKLSDEDVENVKYRFGEAEENLFGVKVVGW